jgi:hypothetical protein
LRKFILLVLFSTVFSTVVVSADFNTIIVDGAILDWSGIPPLVTDPPGDFTGGPEEDIKAVYVSNDEDNLYFWMEMYNNLPVFVAGVESENFQGPEYVYLFFIDAMPGMGDPEYGGADYAIEYSITGFFNVLIIVNRTAGVDQIPFSNTCLFKWNETAGNWTIDYDCSRVYGDASGRNIEVSVAWDCIGGVRCMNTMFMAEAAIPFTDYAPDKDQDLPVTAKVCPSRAVAGELLPRMGIPFTHYLIAATVLLTIVISTYSLRRRKVELYP